MDTISGFSTNVLHENLYKKKDPGNHDNFVQLPGPVGQSDLNNANSQNLFARSLKIIPQNHHFFRVHNLSNPGT